VNPRRSSLMVTGLLAGAIVVVLAMGSLVLYQTSVRPGYTGGGDLLVVLAIGSDAGPPQRPGDPLRGRADAVHLVAVDPQTASASILDIPRDTLVGGRKLNAYLALGGPDRLRDEVEELSGVEIDFWVLTSFQGLIDLVDAQGGITATIDVPMHDPFSGSDFDPGVHRLDGAQALAFARDRHSLPDGDLGRTRHQGELLLAAQRDLSQRDLLGVARLTSAFARGTVTDIPRRDLLSLALLASRINPDTVLHLPLGGRVTMVEGQSVVLLEPGDAFARLRAGEVGPG
jgi:polyisoprenyl-teichoic acid--peptidoglycan teichoic acid transferase